MNTPLNDGLMKVGVGLQNMTAAELSILLKHILIAIFKHLVQGALVILVGATTYVVMEEAVWAVASIPVALVFMAVAIKFIYFTAATGTVLAASQTVNNVHDDWGRTHNPVYDYEHDNIWHNTSISKFLDDD